MCIYIYIYIYICFFTVYETKANAILKSRFFYENFLFTEANIIWKYRY